MGCSNPHPHGQIWTTTGLPEEPALELEQLQKYRREQGGSHMLEDYATLEEVEEERIVFENGSFMVVCPWWATWPFEVMVVSKLHRRALVDLSVEEQGMLADALAEVTRRYDNLFETQFPYSKLASSSSVTQSKCCRTHLKRHGHPPSAPLRHPRRDRSEPPTHPLLPATTTQRDRTKVLGRLRNDGGAAARHHARAGCEAIARVWGRVVSTEDMSVVYLVVKWKK